MLKNTELSRIATILSTSLCLGMISSALAAGGIQQEIPALDLQGANVVRYDSSEPLMDSHSLTMVGRHTKDGGCEFFYPVLTLERDQVALQARQVSTDFTNCLTVVEIGEPLLIDLDSEQLDGTSQTTLSKPLGQEAKESTSLSSASGNYKVWWEDIINLDVTSVQSNISWSYDGTCVTSASGSANYWWLTASGWSKNSSSSVITTGCASRVVKSDATYKNGAFCWPGTVWNYYDDVSVQGTKSNGLSGWVTSTYTTYPFACPTLHYKTQLTRVTG